MDTNSIYKKILNILESNDKQIKSVKLKPNKNYDTINIEKNAAIRIYVNNEIKYISVKFKYHNLLNDPIISNSTKSAKDWIRYQIYSEDDLDDITLAILAIYDDCKPSGTMFGCCSRFNACSDAKKCIHPDIQYAKNCWYQENMKQGLIFYGKNRNI